MSKVTMIVCDNCGTKTEDGLTYFQKHILGRVETHKRQFLIRTQAQKVSRHRTFGDLCEKCTKAVLEALDNRRG